MYNNNIRLHTPLQNINSDMPTALLEILSVSDGIEEVISVGDRKESIGWILYPYDMIKDNTEFYVFCMQMRRRRMARLKVFTEGV